MMTSGENIPYAPHIWKELTLDLLAPSGPAKSRVVLFVHGGGWDKGDKDAMRAEVEFFMRQGFHAASMNYRLSGDAIFPAPWWDVWLAMDFLSSTYSQIVLIGHSAGAHLAVLAGLAQPPGFQPVRKIHLAGVVGVSGVYEMRYEWMKARNFPLRRILEKLFGGSYDTPMVQELARQATPLEYVDDHRSSNAPAFLIVHGEKDAGVAIEQSQLLYEKLRKHHYRVECEIVVDQRHYLFHEHREWLLEKILHFIGTLQEPARK